jgi:ADP-heptose:LPS heptosyltransferase
MNFDSHLAIGSLGKFLRKTGKSFENQSKKFLYSNEKRKNELKKFFSPTKKLLFGIAWKSKNEKIGHFKSINLDEYIPLLKLPNIDFVNLQYGDTKDEINQIEKKYKIKIHNIDELDKFHDLDGLFSLVDLCDYVITSSNVTAHIAGALGKKTFLIIPNLYGAAWYWHDDNFVGWYPSVRIFRQSAQGCWNVPIQNICEEIKKL